MLQQLRLRLRLQQLFARILRPSAPRASSQYARVYGVSYGAQAASDVYSPVSGEVVEFNEKLVEEPGTVRCQATCVVNSCVVIMPCHAVVEF